MIDADRTIPGHAPVPFHIAVKPKKFALRVEGDVVRVARAAGEEFAVPPVHVHAHDKSPRRMRAGAKTPPILRRRQQLVPGIIAQRRAGQNVRRRLGEIAADNIKFVLRPHHNRVRAVFAGAAHRAQKFRRGKTIAPGAQAVNPPTFRPAAVQKKTAVRGTGSAAAACPPLAAK